MLYDAEIDKLIVVGVAGMDPRLTKKYLDMGLMPSTKKLCELGSAREDLILLGGLPTVTSPMWITLSTDANLSTYGITNFAMILQKPSCSGQAFL